MVLTIDFKQVIVDRPLQNLFVYQNGAQKMLQF